ncbi:YD repeat-containing protein [Beauveria brongniartii RCEF 3172]|uniref:YD repeat-containing protein n=1 Tax=Beauveria brongniartii RCEF 3172 TaxID=1081107 RepID=A0A167CF08_9HYPO|nr:YD repeat-containing protein [Beauveria brongniartii RCEF 3172]
MSSLYSQSFNFDSFLQKGVDPRTGQYTATVVVYETPSAARNCPALQLSLTFNPLNTQDVGFGIGWSFNLSSYQHAQKSTKTLTLSTGESFQVKETPSSIRITDQKLKSFQFNKVQGASDQYLVVHKSGLVELLSNQNGGFNVSVPMKLWEPNGRMLTLGWNRSGRQPRLDSISDGPQILLKINYAEHDVDMTVVRAPGTKEESTITISRRNGRLAKVQLPLESTPPWSFEYDTINQVTCLKKIVSPCGLEERVSYSDKDRGHGLPPGAPLKSIPYVTCHVLWPGQQQPAIKTNYNYTATNFLGFGALHNWNDGEDNLYRVRQDYEYSCTVHVDGGAEAKYTYNKFHLLVSHKRHQGTKQVTQSITYYMDATSTFDKQPAQYQLPKSVETTYEDTATRASRTETTHHVFDDWGNPTEDMQSNGVRTGREFYPPGGATGCPADPHGFQRYIKCETVTPAPSSFQTPIRSKQYIYSQHRTASSSYTSYFVAVDKVQALQDGQEFSTWEYSYVDQPDSRDHGRRQQQIIRISAKCPMTTTWNYEYPDSDSMKRTVTTKSYDGYTAEATTHLSTLSGLAYTHKSIAGVQTDFEYDKIGQLTKKIVSPNTSYQTSEEHRYSVLQADIGYCVMTKDAKGVQTRYITDGLERICKVDRQDADADGDVSNSTFRTVQERSYNNIGQCVAVVDSDWLRTKGEPTEQQLRQSLEYDDWGQTCRVHESNGITTLSLTDPIGQAHTEGIEGQGKTESKFNDFGLPIETVIYKIDGSVYATTAYGYDGLGRLVLQKDALNRATQYKLDCFDRVTQTIRQDGQAVNTTYAAQSSSIWPTSIDTNNHCVGKQLFDGLGRITLHEVGGRATAQSFEGCAPAPSTTTTPKGDVRRLLYEPQLDYALMALTSKDAAETIQYDAQTVAPVKLKNLYSTTDLTHLPSGLVDKVSLDIENGPVFSTESFYSMAGKMQGYTNPHGEKLEIQYNAEGKPRQLAQGPLSVTFAYDQVQRLVESCVQDGANSSLITHLTYDDFSREIGRSVRKGSKLLHQLTQTYLQTGHLAMRRLEDGNGELLLEEAFTYDVLDRLVDFECQGPQSPTDEQGNQIRQQSFTFGPFHNLVEITTIFQTGDKNVKRYTYADQDPGQVIGIRNSHHGYPTKIDLKYDQNGCLIRDEQGNKLEYDSTGHLITLRDSQSRILSEYRYDASGKLVCQLVPGKDEYYLHYRGNTLVGYTWGNDCVSFVSDGTCYWGQTVQKGTRNTQTQLWASDMHASVTAWINSDESDSHYSRQYTPYGYNVQDADKGPSIGFNGQWCDPVTGWYHLGNGYRVYNPVLMHFHSPDSWSPFQSGEINPYGYCLGDPINNIDPSGHFSLFGIKFTWRDLAIAVAGIAVGIAVGVLTGGAGFAIEAGLGIACGLASDVMTGAVYDQATGHTPTWKSVGTDALYSLIGGVVGEGAGKVVGAAGKSAVRGLGGMREGAGVVKGMRESLGAVTQMQEVRHEFTGEAENLRLVGKGPGKGERRAAKLAAQSASTSGTSTETVTRYTVDATHEARSFRIDEAGHEDAVTNYQLFRRAIEEEGVRPDVAVTRINRAPHLKKLGETWRLGEEGPMVQTWQFQLNHSLRATYHLPLRNPGRIVYIGDVGMHT